MKTTQVRFPRGSRRGRVFTWFASKCYVLGLASGTMWSNRGEQAIYWTGKRVYVLGAKKDHWRCVLKFHHWPGVPVGFGMCGKCCPWPCCGSTTWDHAPDCREAA